VASTAMNSHNVTATPVLCRLRTADRPTPACERTRE
jgi:hypothetical protein